MTSKQVLLSLLKKETPKFKKYAKNITNKRCAGGRCTTILNMTLSMQKILTVMCDLGTTEIVPHLLSIWESMLLIIPSTDADNISFSFLIGVISHHQYQVTFSENNTSPYYIKYRDLMLRTLQFVVQYISTQSNIQLPEPQLRGTRETLHTETERRTCSFELVRSMPVTPPKKSVFSKKKDKLQRETFSKEAFIPFVVKVLSCAFLRLPVVRKVFIQHFEKLWNIKSEWVFKEALLKHFPNLLAWDQYDHHNKSVEVELDLSFFEREKTLFIMVFHDIVYSVDSHVGNKVLKWKNFQGYDIMLETYIKYYKDYCMSDEYIHAMDGVIVTSDHPAMINFYMRTHLENVNMCDPDAVLTAIADLEFFFSKLRVKVMLLKSDFNIGLLCKFIDFIIESQNTTTLVRILSLIYTYADLFSGETRKSFFIDYLLEKQYRFFSLFWEDNITGLYIQLLLFKGTFAKTNNLVTNKFDVNEISLYKLQEGCENMTPVELDRAIMNKVKNKFEDSSVNNLSVGEKVYHLNAVKLYYYFKDLYEQWQSSKSSVFPNLIHVHSIKQRDEMYLINHHEYD